MDGLEMNSGFQISVSSELMAILAIAEDLKDMRKRISQMVVASSRNGKEITTADLEVDGAMAALMLDTFNPTIVQTLEVILFLFIRSICKYRNRSKFSDFR